MRASEMLHNPANNCAKKHNSSLKTPFQNCVLITGIKGFRHSRRHFQFFIHRVFKDSM